MERVVAGDTIVFDSVSRMSRDAAPVLNSTMSYTAEIFPWYS